jgi:mannosyltransferase
MLRTGSGSTVDGVTVAARRPRVVVRVRERPLAIAGAAVLLLLALHVRTRALGSPFWGDEGLSVGVASHPLTAIPGVLREDGSPPLYYVLLHVWMAAFGTGEAATRGLSLLFALATVPVGLWLGSSLFGRRAGWACAALAALNPLLSVYAQETRMYSLVALLSMLAAGALVQVAVYRRRQFRWLLAGTLAALLYTHSWGLFLGATAAVVYLALMIRAGDRRALLVDGAIAFGGAALLFAPWLPTLLFQAAHTGAPWASTPHLRSLPRAIVRVAAGAGPLIALGVAAAAMLWSRPRRADLEAAGALVVLAAGTLLLAWAYSQHEAAWASRYLTILLGPLLLLAGLIVARAGAAGAAALVILAITWFQLPAYHSVSHKSNIRTVAAGLAPWLRPHDLVVAAQPETTPLLHYQLRSGLRFADAMGAVSDPRVMDWRDALARLRRSTPAAVLALAHRLPHGGRLALVRPVTNHSGWHARWTHLVKVRAAELAAALERDPGLHRVATIHPGRPGSESTLRAVVYARR